MACGPDCPRLKGTFNIAHCATCHETFSTAYNFDLHRRLGACLLPDAELGMVKRDGVWRRPLDERQKGRLAAMRESERR